MHCRSEEQTNPILAALSFRLCFIPNWNIMKILHIERSSTTALHYVAKWDFLYLLLRSLELAENKSRFGILSSASELTVRL